MSLAKRVAIDSVLILIVGAVVFLADYRYRQGEMAVLGVSRLVRLSGTELRVGSCAYTDFAGRLASRKDGYLKSWPEDMGRYRVTIGKLKKHLWSESDSVNTWMVLIDQGALTLGGDFVYEIRQDDCAILAARPEK
ncbi:MAG: hypothetical protein NTY77_18685 [Elusimicrobia bacterium]|nr:hypothetical protein [Elusimicrobiota bacterium]